MDLYQHIQYESSMPKFKILRYLVVLRGRVEDNSELPSH